MPLVHEPGDLDGSQLDAGDVAMVAPADLAEAEVEQELLGAVDLCGCGGVGGGGGMLVGGPLKENKGSGKWSRVSEVRMREVRGTKTRWHR
jgi:hypothetical protein